MMNYHTNMARAKIAITIDETALDEIDRLIAQGTYRNRSQAIQVAIEDRLARIYRSRLAAECAKLIKSEEQALAEEGYSGDTKWPEY